MPIKLSSVGIFVNKIANSYNYSMKLKANELIKLLLAKEGLTQKELAVILTEKTSKKYTPDGLSRKLKRGTITYNEVAETVDILGYNIIVERKNQT